MAAEVHPIEPMQDWANMVIGSDVAEVMANETQRIAAPAKPIEIDAYLEVLSKYRAATPEQQASLRRAARTLLELQGPPISDDAYSGMHIPASALQNPQSS